MEQTLHTVGTSIMPLLFLLIVALFALLYLIKMIAYIIRHSVWARTLKDSPDHTYYRQIGLHLFYNSKSLCGLGFVRYTHINLRNLHRYDHIRWHLIIFNWHIIL